MVLPEPRVIWQDGANWGAASFRLACVRVCGGFVLDYRLVQESPVHCEQQHSQAGGPEPSKNANPV